MNSVPEIIDVIEKQKAIIAYLAEVEDRSGLSEILLSAANALDECSIALNHKFSIVDGVLRCEDDHE